MGLLVNATSPSAEPNTLETQEAAHKLVVELHVVSASNTQKIDAAFATLVQQRAQALVIDGDPLFVSRRLQLVALTTRQAMPAIYTTRDFPVAGGLMSYGATDRPTRPRSS
jgi:putative tryptophan/tyrosine transport system substrate-binding protein